MHSDRTLSFDPHYNPVPAKKGDEIYPAGKISFNISRVLEYIEDGKLMPVMETINLSEWFSTHFRRGTLHESHMLNVDITKPVIQAEIRPGVFEIIDGNHRMAKARRQGIDSIESYKIFGHELLPFFLERKHYERFIDIWNDTFACELFSR